MDAGDAEQAEILLKAVLESKSDEGLRSVAALRLATVYLANDKQDSALKLLDAQPDNGLSLFQARSQELRGDIYQQKGDADKARESYASSISALQQLGQPATLIELKLDNL